MTGRDRAQGAQTAGAVATALLSLVIGEIYEVCVTEYVEQGGDVAAQRKDMAGGCPLIDPDTWQHAAAAVLSGACPPCASCAESC